MERRSPLILMTKTDRAFQKRYFARLWEEAATEAGVGSITLPGLDEPVALHFHDLRGTAVTMLSEAGCSPQQIATTTGHSLKTVTVILDCYLARTTALADQATFNWENSPRTEFANRLQTTTPTPKASKGKLMSNNRVDGAPERIRTSDPQIRSLVLYPAELRAPFFDSRRLSRRFSSCLVGVAGFEPATPTSRTWCATRLRYTPMPPPEGRRAGL